MEPICIYNFLPYLTFRYNFIKYAPSPLILILHSRAAVVVFTFGVGVGGTVRVVHQYKDVQQEPDHRRGDYHLTVLQTYPAHHFVPAICYFIGKKNKHSNELLFKITWDTWTTLGWSQCTSATKIFKDL